MSGVMSQLSRLGDCSESFWNLDPSAAGGQKLPETRLAYAGTMEAETGLHTGVWVGPGVCNSRVGLHTGV